MLGDEVLLLCCENEQRKEWGKGKWWTIKVQMQMLKCREVGEWTWKGWWAVLCGLDWLTMTRVVIVREVIVVLLCGF